MKNDVLISASIVLYKEDFIEINKTIQCFLNIPLKKKLFLIDNSPTDELKQIANHPEIEYFFINKNIGFGSGHNKVISKIKGQSNYHLILNPDVVFKPNVIPKLIEQIEKEVDVSIIAPKVLFPNNSNQFSCRRFPSFFELVFRRFKILRFFFPSVLKRGEYRDKNLLKPFYPEFLTGCFQLFRTVDFIEINGFDERYFLYMEDIDICRKIDNLGKKKLYYPNEKIYHNLKKGSSKNIKLFFYHISSIFKYFYKWNIQEKRVK